MTRRDALPFALRSLLLLALCALPFATAAAQSSTATLSGTVTDPNGAVVPGVKVTVTDPATRLQRTATTNDGGQFVVPLLPPSTYDLTLERAGFMTAAVNDIVLNVNDERSLAIKMKVGDVSETVNVTDEASLINDSPAVATTVDRQFVANIPLNGRSFQSLVNLSPGVTLTRSDFNEPGQFSVNGQRPSANYFTVDGVGANTGINAVANLSQTAGGTTPAFNAAGGTSSIVSIDAMQEFKIQTSTFAPEFGRTPGAQVQILTRSGTNDFRGTIFEYFRNDALDANDWFANSRNQKKPPLRQNNFGGVFGGPILKDRTFFFFSYEGNRLRLPQTQLTSVPSLASRLAAPQQIRPLLNAYPIPNGANLANGFAEFSSSYSDPSTLDASSIRLDHAFTDKINVFGRYNYVPSSSATRGQSTSLNAVAIGQFKNQTLTLGSTQTLAGSVINEVRFSYTKTEAGIINRLDDFGGATPLDISVFLPASADPDDTFFQVSLGTSVTIPINRHENLQRHFNVVDNLSWIKGSHQIKVGVDYRHLLPLTAPTRYSQAIFFTGLSTAPGGALSGVSSRVLIQGKDPVAFSVSNLSLYAQDTWKVNSRLTLTHGLRWELNPAPRGRGAANEPYTFDNLDNPSQLTLAPRGTPLYETTYGNFAPRIGLAYQLSQKQGRETVLRGGFGLFYDLGYGQIFISTASFPFARSVFLFNVPVPLTTLQATAPTFSTNPPFVNLVIADRNLRLPYSYQWNFSVEQSLGTDQALSASYVAAVGRRLLRREILPPNPRYTNIFINVNTGTSDYHSLQLQFQRRLSKGLQALASYTWAKSLDNASLDSTPSPSATRVDPQLDRGPSDFDVRQAFSAAITYNLPSPRANKPLIKALFDNWSVHAIVIARSATPVNVTVSRTIPDIGTFAFRPDVISNIPLYISDPTFAGGRRINRSAFVIPTALVQGTLGRNSLRGFPLSQLDLALHRQFNVTERLKLQFRAEFFNVLNHPNFADPIGNLTNSLFGQSTQTLGRSLGSGGTNGGFSPLYQIGGPRSIQFVMRLQF